MLLVYLVRHGSLLKALWETQERGTEEAPLQFESAQPCMTPSRAKELLSFTLHSCMSLQCRQICLLTLPSRGSLHQVQAPQRLVAGCVGKNDINTIGPVIPQILRITRHRNRGTVLQPSSWFELSALCDATGGIGGRELEAQRYALILRAGMSTWLRLCPKMLPSTHAQPKVSSS